MKSKFIRFVSSLLIVAFLVSCFAVLSFADTSAEDENAPATPDPSLTGVTVITNRGFEEGWDYDNGFNTKPGGHIFKVEHEENADYGYNYYTRIEGTSQAEGHVEVSYGANAANFGTTIFEFDVKTDDIANMGTIAYMHRKENININYRYPLASIVNNELYLIGHEKPVIENIKGNSQMSGIAMDPSYLIGSSDNEWIHLAFVINVNERVCPDCGKVVSLTAGMADSTEVCEKQEINEAGEVVKTPITVADMAKQSTMTVYYGYSDTFDPKNAVEASKDNREGSDLNGTYFYNVVIGDITTVDYFRIGLPSSKENFGSSICYDEVKLYNGASKITDISSLGYGANVNTEAAKTIEILGGAKTVTQYINEGLAMKVGVDYCLDQGTRRPAITSESGVAYGAPVEIDGKYFVSLQAVLDWVGYPMYEHEDGVSFDISTESGSTFIGIGRSLATSNGELVQLTAAPGLATDEETGLQYIVVAVEDIEILFDGYYVTYDETGLIIVASAPDLVNRATDLELMLDIMKRFVYDPVNDSTLYGQVKENTNNFQHPYLIANQSDFDKIQTSTDANIVKYIAAIKAQAEEIYGEFTTPAMDDEGNYAPKAYTYLAAEIINPNTIVGEGYYSDEKYLNGGYDYAIGRLAESGEYNSKILSLAFAYQVTKETKYALLAYDMAVSMGKWEHWGPAYFISLADAATPYALAYDWLYNVWKSEGCDLAPIENAIYTHCISQGYYASTGVECKFLSNQGDFSAYTDKTNTWNVSGTSAMVIASLALMGTGYNIEADGRVNSFYTDSYETQSIWLIKNNIKTLTENGLDMYAPDGSFATSPSYWSYATNALCLMSWALRTSVGSDFGLMNACGVDKTFYYAYQTEYSMNNLIVPEGYQYWAYNDAPIGYQATEMSFFAAAALGNSDIAVLRLNQLGKKPSTMWDILGYDAAYTEINASDVKLGLDYVLESCDGFISRSSWEDGALFVGVMAGRNDVEGGQADSGNFVYSNYGFNWICELGGEYHGVEDYTDQDIRYTYYRLSGDGNNIVVITSGSAMLAGQIIEAGGKITKYENNEFGMYTVIDNGDVYGSAVETADRGILLTNDRQTVVVQDYFSFPKVASCAWIVHTPVKTSDIQISTDGKTAFLVQKIGDTTYYLRATIISKVDLKFQKADAYKTVLGSTKDKKSTLYREQITRDGYSKLYIEAKDVIAFDCAVVFEIVPSPAYEDAPHYNYTALSDWNASLINEVYVPPVVDEYEMPTVFPDDIVTYMEEADRIYQNGYAFSSRVVEFYVCMVRCTACVKTFKPSGQLEDTTARADALKDYEELIKHYNAYSSEILKQTVSSELIGIYLSGYNGQIPD